MNTTKSIPCIPELPDDMLSALMWVSGTASTSHVRPEQQAAAMALNATTSARDLPEALRNVVRAYTKDIRGHTIPRSSNWLHRHASLLADQVDDWLQERRIAA